MIGLVTANLKSHVDIEGKNAASKIRRRFGRCIGRCRGLCVYEEPSESGRFFYFNGDSHSQDHAVDFSENPNVMLQAPKWLRQAQAKPYDLNSKQNNSPARLVFTAGGAGDPSKPGYGLCVTCNGTRVVKFQAATGLWVSPGGQSHTGHLIEPFRSEDQR